LRQAAAAKGLFNPERIGSMNVAGFDDFGETSPPGAKAEDYCGKKHLFR
jgi:hypothetical protein